MICLLKNKNKKKKKEKEKMLNLDSIISTVGFGKIIKF
jgi:hypothetical protein